MKTPPKRINKTKGKAPDRIIELEKGFRLAIDKYNVKVQEYQQKQKEDTDEIYFTWETVGYYFSIINALKGLTGHELKQANSYDDLITRIENLENRFEALKKYTY